MFAIALTLPVLSIGLPRSVSDAASEVWSALADVQSQFIAFGVAFALLGRYRHDHHKFVSGLTEVTTRLMGLNLMYLAFVALLPFPTSLVGHYDENPVSALVFALTLATGYVVDAVGRRQGVAIQPHRSKDGNPG